MTSLFEPVPGGDVNRAAEVWGRAIHEKYYSANGSFLLDRLLDYEAENTVQTVRWGFAQGREMHRQNFQRISQIAFRERNALLGVVLRPYPFAPTIQHSMSGGIDLSGEMFNFLLVRLKP